MSSIFCEFKEVRRDGLPISLIFPNESFGYQTITVERFLRDADGNVVSSIKAR